MITSEKDSNIFQRKQNTIEQGIQDGITQGVLEGKELKVGREITREL